MAISGFEPPGNSSTRIPPPRSCPRIRSPSRIRSSANNRAPLLQAVCQAGHKSIRPGIEFHRGEFACIRASANHANYRGRIKRTVAEIFQSLPPFNYVKFKGAIATKINSKPPPPPPSIDTIFYFIVFTLRAHPNFSKISSFSHSSSSQRVTHPSIPHRLDIHVSIKASKQNTPLAKLSPRQNIPLSGNDSRSRMGTKGARK